MCKFRDLIFLFFYRYKLAANKQGTRVLLGV